MSTCIALWSGQSISLLHVIRSHAGVCRMYNRAAWWSEYIVSLRHTIGPRVGQITSLLHVIGPRGVVVASCYRRITCIVRII